MIHQPNPNSIQFWAIARPHRQISNFVDAQLPKLELSLDSVDGSSQGDGKFQTEFERELSRLNTDSRPSSDFAAVVDHALLLSLSEPVDGDAHIQIKNRRVVVLRTIEEIDAYQRLI